MANDIVNQVEELFSDKEQWVSFLDLASQKDFLRNSWWQAFRSEMNKCFTIDNPVDGWALTSWGTWDYRWYLKEFGDQSLCLWCREWGGSYSLLLWANQSIFDVVQISKLLQEQKYLPILSAFERQDEIPNQDNTVKLMEHGNFQFGDTMDGHFTVDRLAWYIHYKPDEFISQILNKINRFRDAEITKLLRDINTATKKAK